MNGASTRSRRSPGFSGAHLRPATRLAARRAALIADESERFFSLPPTLRSRLVGQQIRSAFRNSDWLPALMSIPVTVVKINYVLELY